LVITAVWAIASEAVRPASMSIISSMVSAEQRKAVFALNRLMINLGMSVGPAAAGFLALWSFRLLFLVDGATSVLSAVALTLLLRTPVTAAATNKSTETIDKPSHRFGALADGRLVYFLVALVP